MNLSGDDHAADGVALLREQLQLSLANIDALDRKLALVVPVMGGVAALAAPTASGTGLQVGLLAAGIIVAALAAILSLFGLGPRAVSFGPNARKVAWRIRKPYREYDRDVAQGLQSSINLNVGLADRKARSFNLAAVSATCAILLLIVARAAENR